MRFVLSGYYGFSNAGDEAILAGALSALRRAGVDATVLSAQPELTRRQHGVEALRRSSLRDVRRALRGADLFLSGGGGLLQDATSLRSLVFYLFMLRLARKQGVPTMIFAQGIGPLKRRISRLLVGREANAARCITVRDEASRQALESIGVKRAIHVTADASFLMDTPDEAASESLWRAARLNSLPRPVIGAALRPWGSPAWTGEVGAALDDFARRIGGSVALLPFHAEADYPLAVSIGQRLQCPRKVVEPAAGPEDLLAIVSRCDVIVGMRLHSLIFSVMSATPCVALSYDPKVDAFAREAGVPLVIPLRGVTQVALSSAMLQCWENRAGLAARCVSACKALRERAAGNIELALLAAGG